MKRHYLSFADWSLSEYAVILRCLLTARISEGEYPAILSEKLAQLYAPSSVYICNYGHHAIQIALEIFQRRQPARNEVIVPAYICPSVVQAIHACGLRAISVEVGSDLNLQPGAMRAAFGAATLAVIAPHMYGCPAAIGEIEKACASAGIFLIDDAAQVAGVRHHDRLLGSFGDVGIISFAQSKTIVTGIQGSGGVLLINRPQFDSEARQVWEQLPPAQGRLAVVADFVWNHLWSAYTGHSGYYLGRILAKMGCKQTVNKNMTRISHLEAGIALAQLKRLPLILQEKIRIAEAYHQALREQSSILFPQFAEGRFLARVMLQLPEAVQAGRFRTFLKSIGLESRPGYEAYVSAQASVQKAEKLSRQLFGVPCRAGMSNHEIHTICQRIEHALQNAQPALFSR